MDKETERTYRATNYCLWLADGQFVLHIDEPASQVMEVLRTKFALRGDAFIVTPCNPRSQALSDTENRERLLKFRQELSKNNVRWLPAVNRDPKDEWPDEPGALFLDCGLKFATDLGKQYEQNAIVSLGKDAVPRLVIL